MATKTCPKCDGSGTYRDSKCQVCDGSGNVQTATKEDKKTLSRRNKGKGKK